MRRRVARWLANQRRLPTSFRAVFGYYADSGIFAYNSLSLKRRVNCRVEEMVAETFDAVETAIAEAFGYGYVSFSYETKLLLPAKLTLGQIYRTHDETEHARAEGLTHLTIEALLDGDMRDARNDEEYEDFEVDFETDASDRARIAEIAQEVLQARVEQKLGTQDADIREIYEWAVNRSERHQSDDEAFRELLAQAPQDESARDRIHETYKTAPFEDPPDIFDATERELPYLRTQYDRVGVIYDGMVQIYRAAGFTIDDAFHRSIVFAIIGAQIWLDDIDDYEADMAEGQLTPVTAEYALASDNRDAYNRVVDISKRYLELAKGEAMTADSILTGVATEYILRDGRPDRLPGSPSS